MIFAEFKVDNNKGVFDAWQYLGRDWATPSSAFVAAHDLVEHGENDNGTIEQELMALGAGLLLRRKINIYNNSEIISHDISHVLSNFLPVSGIADYNTKDCGPIPHEIISFLNGASSLAAHWLESSKPDLSTEIFEKAMKWVHIGLFRAYLKYDKNIKEVQTLFKELYDLFKKFTGRGQPSGILRIVLDINTGFDYEFEIT